MSHTPDTHPAHDAAPRGRWADMLLLAAVALAAIVLLRPDHTATAAAAGDTAQRGEFTVLTFDGGGSGDVVLVLDSRNEDLLAYSVENQRTVVFHRREKISELFDAAAPNRRGSRNSGGPR